MHGLRLPSFHVLSTRSHHTGHPHKGAQTSQSLRTRDTYNEASSEGIAHSQSLSQPNTGPVTGLQDLVHQTVNIAASAVVVGATFGVTARATPDLMGGPTLETQNNNDVVLVGMNKGSGFEARSLRNRGLRVHHVKDANNWQEAEWNLHDLVRSESGTVFNLSTTEGISAFVGTLRLPSAQSEKIKIIIERTSEDGKDELSQLAAIWAKAARGGQIPSRLVLSGHSSGDTLWGDFNGELLRGDFADLAEAMPKAAAQIEDLHLSGCYTGGQFDLEAWREVFPNLKTIWAYTGSAPGSYSGATTHLARWDQATRGQVNTLDRNVARGTRKGENISTWSFERGYENGQPPAPYTEVRREFDDSQSWAYTDYFSGALAVENPQSGDLRYHYNITQRLLQHTDLPESERNEITAHRDSTIRLLYYTKTIAGKFQDYHQEAINAGFSSLGLTSPDFSTLSRQEALAYISDFEQRFQSMRTPPAAAQSLLPLLTGGLRDLNSAIIPSTWI